MKIFVRRKLWPACIVLMVCVVGIVFFYRHISRAQQAVRSSLSACIMPDADALLHIRTGSGTGCSWGMPGRICVELDEAGLSGKDLLTVCHGGSPEAQLVLCDLSEAEGVLLEQSLVRQKDYSPEIRTILYGGRQIRICPLDDGSFLSCCQLTPAVWAASLHKKLIEKTIDFVAGQVDEETSSVPLSLGKTGTTLWLRSESLHRLYRGTGLTPDTAFWKPFSCTVCRNGIRVTGTEECGPEMEGSWCGTELAAVLPASGVCTDSILSYFTYCEQKPCRAYTDTLRTTEPFVSRFDACIREAGGTGYFLGCSVPADSVSSGIIVALPVRDAGRAEVLLQKWMAGELGNARAKAFFYEKNRAYALYKLPVFPFSHPLTDGVSRGACWMTVSDRAVLLATSRTDMTAFLASRHSAALKRAEAASQTPDKDKLCVAWLACTPSAGVDGSLPEFPWAVVGTGEECFPDFEYVCSLDRLCDELELCWFWRM